MTTEFYATLVIVLAMHATFLLIVIYPRKLT